MIVVTGAAGFIGSCLISGLNDAGFKDIVAVDKFDNPLKKLNLINKKILYNVDRDVFFEWVKQHVQSIDFVFHLGARTDTIETSKDLFDQLNLNYSKLVWQLCAHEQIPLVYASSAATYGDGQYGYNENIECTKRLKPLNPYAVSKHGFDLWVLDQELAPPKWCGLKFFNVFGPNEYHKGKMASMVYQSFQQIGNTHRVRLFKSYLPQFQHGEQSRDFIYVKDTVRLIIRLMQMRESIGLLNVGTGASQGFNTLVGCVYESLGLVPKIEYIDMPDELKPKYQYHTAADLCKLKNHRLSVKMTPLDEAIRDYVTNYLIPEKYL